ncbi:hypothetical protein GX51_04866 [Blastomyces parvus]|uniref:Zn(2)-C6 fungal-type domain-containing protein n=1 Tax=Blastomyces parvus TaxID=2060905 RepID=A0A2B7WRP3_9EURO|nr:hypothetical protein GX51_04866 [Blastomyces parvus]
MSFSNSLPMPDGSQEPFRSAEWLRSPPTFITQKGDHGLGQATILQPGTGSETGYRTRQRVSLACLPCRSRHVKCDSASPVCSRCKFDGRHCKYIQSRRGGHNKIVSRETQGPGTQSPTKGPESSHTSSAEQISILIDDSDSPGVVGTGTNFESPTSTFSTSPDRPIECYYSLFHESHPMVLPKQHFMARLEVDQESLEAVAAVVRYIGSLCGHCPFPESFKSLSENLLFCKQLPKNGFSVQALMLYSIATHWNNEKPRAREILDIATSLALEIGMNSRQFAYQYGEGNPNLEESWRRTWWLLYVVDSLYAGIWRAPAFALWSVSSDVDLPCEEDDYHSGNIPKPRTLLEYDERQFDAVDAVFSSFTYLIDASRILGTILIVGLDEGNPVDPEVDYADSVLVAWSLHLPDIKKELVTRRGNVDPMLFLAHMLINTTTIYLHRPRSKLLYSNAENISKCAPPPPPERLTLAAQEAYQLHTVKALTAAERISSLLALPTTLVKQSQFIICMVALSTIVQLSAYIFDPNVAASRALKERIRVNLGALRAHEKIWPLGRKSLEEVKSIARQVFALQKFDTQVISDLLANPCNFPNHPGNSIMLDESLANSIFGDSSLSSPLSLSR